MTRTVYRGAALADGTGSELQGDVSVVVEGGRILSIGPSDDERDAVVIDCSGAPGARAGAVARGAGRQAG